jgi:DNA-binding beta-propeller fold protein YncE
MERLATMMEEAPPSVPGGAFPAVGTIRCPTCLEAVPADAPLCPECGEPTAPTSGPRSVQPSSAMLDDPPGASWLSLHWRPLATMLAVSGLIGAGIALRHLAPDRYRAPGRLSTPAAAVSPACDTPCWHGEACENGKCVWQPSNDAGHLPAQPGVAGPFQLPSDFVDVLPLDGERFAVSYMLGVQVTGSKTGEVLSLVSDAPQAQQLVRVDDVFYASAPKRIYVIDAKSTRVLKSIEIGSPTGELTVGASGRRILASVPGQRSVAVIATDYHAEVARFFFGDDQVGPVALDDTGTRGFAANGRVPLPGLEPPFEAVRYGGVYAFDPMRLPSVQDRVRTGLVGNPVDLVMLPDASSSYVALREADTVAHLERSPSGSVRLENSINVCRQPEELALAPAGRRLLVRCNAGQAVEVIDLVRHRILRHVPLPARVTDMAVTPDGRQAVLVLPRDGKGQIALLDLDSYEIETVELGAEPHRVRLAPDGRTAVVVSDRSKVAWLIR